MSESVVKVGNHWGSVDAEWVRNKTDPPTGLQVPVAISGPMDTSKPEEVKSATKPQTPRNGNSSNAATSDD